MAAASCDLSVTMTTAPNFPRYDEVEDALYRELVKRGGSAAPSDRNHGRTVYEALADHFRLSQEARDAVIYESGTSRSKWENMVRWGARKLKEQGKLDRSSPRGIWKIKD